MISGTALTDYLHYTNVFLGDSFLQVANISPWLKRISMCNSDGRRMSGVGVSYESELDKVSLRAFREGIVLISEWFSEEASNNRGGPRNMRYTRKDTRQHS